MNDKNKYIPIQILNRLNGKFCTECQYVGSVRFETIQHIQNIHLKTKLFQCNLCNFESLKLRVLKKHFENSHLLPTISKNIQKKRQIKSNKNNSKRNIFLKSQEFSRKKGRNRDNTQIIRTDDEEKIRNPGKRKFAPNSNELPYPGEVKKSLNNQRKSDELVVPEASKDHCPQNNSKIMESNSQDIHILEKHSQSLEVENVVDDGIIPANKDTIQIPNTSTKVSDENSKKNVSALKIHTVSLKSLLKLV